MSLKCAGCHQFQPESKWTARLVRGVEKPYKSCSDCRARASKRNNDPKVVIKKKQWRSDNVEKVKAVTHAFNHQDDVKASRELHQKSDKGKSDKNRYMSSEKGITTLKKWEDSEAGRLSKKGRNAKAYKKMMSEPETRIWERLRVKISKMMSGQKTKSSTVALWTSFNNRTELLKHMEEQFEGTSFTVKNYGTKWHIGHRIAKSMYNKKDPDDVRLCWDAANLFPQDANENVKLGVLLPSDEQLLALKSIWPLAWNDTLPNTFERRLLEKNAAAGFC